MSDLDRSRERGGVPGPELIPLDEADDDLEPDDGGVPELRDSTGFDRLPVGDDEDDHGGEPAGPAARQERHRVGSRAAGAPAPRMLERSRRRLPQALALLTASVAVLAVGVFLAAVLALEHQSTSSAWTAVLQDVVKTGYQAVAIGALGGLGKIVLDRRQAGEQTAAEVRDRRRGYINTLVSAAHDVETARMMIRANRSVLTWTRMTTDRVVPAWVRLRQLGHEITNWSAAGQDVFADPELVRYHLDAMVRYLALLVEEHADVKQELGEKQNAAERPVGEARSTALVAIWNELRRLRHTGDLIDDGAMYGSFRDHYLAALTVMRTSLADDSLPAPRNRPTR